MFGKGVRVLFFGFSFALVGNNLWAHEEKANEINEPLILLEGKILNDKINFKYFFKPSSCIKKDLEKNFSLHQSGGRIVNLDNDNLLLSIGEFRSRLLAQNTESINGKIIAVINGIFSVVPIILKKLLK